MIFPELANKSSVNYCIKEWISESKISWTERWNIRNRLLERWHLYSKKFTKTKWRAGYPVLDTWRWISNRWRKVLFWIRTSYLLWKYRCSSSISIRNGWIWNWMYIDSISVKGSSDASHFIFEINVGKSRIRHRTTLNLNGIIFYRFIVDLEIHYTLFQSRFM